MIPRDDITGLVLAGGRGSRMGGADKGLQPYHGVPLALHALQRLRPQVGALALNANRHLDTCAGFGVPVWPDPVPDQPGPLAGFLAGLQHCTTPWLATVPCDSPRFPPDLVARLAEALQAERAELAIAVTEEAGERRRHPVFCLMARGLRDSLADELRQGRRRVDAWTARHRCAQVLFDDANAFANANTAEELQQLQER